MERKYLQSIHLTKDLFSEFRKNSPNSIARKQINIKWAKNFKTLHPRRYTDGKRTHKTCSTALFTGEGKTKPTERYHYTFTQMAKTKKTDQTYNSHTLLMRMWNGMTTLENSLAVLHKVKHSSTIWPTVPLLGICTREMKHVHIKTCMWMLMAAFFFIITSNEITQMLIKTWMDKELMVYS